MLDMVGAAGDGLSIPGINQVKYQRRMDGDGRMQARWWLPRTIAHAGDILPFDAGCAQRQP